MGAYIAEGDITPCQSGIDRFRLGNSNKKWLEERKQDFQKITSGNGSINYQPDRREKRFGEKSKSNKGYKKIYVLTCRGNTFTYLVKTICGRKLNKKVPDFIFTLKKEYQIEFLKTAMEGDGILGKNNHADVYSTSAYKLACGMSLLGKILEYRLTIYGGQSKWSKHKNYRIGFHKGPVKDSKCQTTHKQSAYNGYMYDLEVENNHNFTEALGLVLESNTWMQTTIAENHVLNRYKYVAYIPVDSQPLPLSSLPVFSEADVLVMYTYWGQQIIKHQFPFLKTTVIHHGVDTEVFHPLSYEHKMNIRRQMNIPPDTFIVGNFNRNQPRKNIPEMLQAFRLFLNPWSSCPKCKETFFVPLNECPNCGGKVYTGPGKTKREAVLFLHMLLDAPPEQGWNISEKVYGGKPGGLIERYNLKGYILHTEGINIGMGVSDEKLNELYNFVDLNLNVSAAEGFGLTSLEAIAAGNAPSLVSNYGGHLDFIDNIGRTVNSFYYRPQPISNVEWCVPDIVDFTKKLDLFYYNDPDIIRKKYNIEKKKDFLCGKELRNYYTTEGRQKIIKEYNWDVIAQQWLNLFRSIKLNRLDSKKPVQLEQI